MNTISYQINPNVSQTFHIGKFFLILAVFTGHYFDNIEILWVPVTIALLIFSWSSGFFTYLKYNGNFNKKKFWQKKTERLAVNLAVINIFLFVLFFIQDRSGIWTWQTIVNIFGMNGFLNWLRIPDYSPFGNGMWFFTLLIIFYILYPGLEFINRRVCVSCFFSIISVGIAFYLNIIYGHALWLTICGFITDIFCARNNIRFPKYISIVSFLFILGVTLYFNYFLKIRDLNFFSLNFWQFLLSFHLKI